MVRIPKRWWARATKQFAAIAIATAAVVAVTAGPASAVYDFSQGFEHDMDSSWHWDGTGGGSALWYNDTCGQARTGCGGVLMRQGVSGYRALYTTVHLSALANGWCTIGYYAQLWNSTGPATARLEILNPDWTYLSLTDRTLTNSTWTYVGTGFPQWGARDVIIRITLPGSGTTANSAPTINTDDLNVHCFILLEGRG